MAVVPEGKKSKVVQLFQKARLISTRGLKRQRRSTVFLVLALVGIVGVVGFNKVHAETYPGGTDNGLTSRLISLNGTLTGLGFGSTTNTPDWGSDWNRVTTAAEWTPSGTATTNEALSGKTFYANGTHTAQTGTFVAPGVCPTQTVWAGSESQTNSCAPTWTVPTDGVTGTDHEDPNTGLAWSEYLINNSGTIGFSTSAPTAADFSWTSAASNNIGYTASQLCTKMGNGWRLPTMNELLEADVDGADYYLNGGSGGGNNQNLWTATAYNGTAAIYYGNIYYDFFNEWSSTNTIAIRCVRAVS